MRLALLLLALHGAAVTAATVTLGSGQRYAATPNATSGLTIFKGIRYAQPPVGRLRWQAPLILNASASATPAAADTWPLRCPQTLSNTAAGRTGLLGLALGGTEDCLFLNVWTPTASVTATTDGARRTALLPVLVWIHGGGYALGDASSLDMTAFVNDGGNDVVVVAVQYRLGAFGFLASPEVNERGVLNAGLLDQRLALEWVQENIGSFGGDKNRVTIMGESAGGGSVLLHAIAEDGGLGTTLFKNIIAPSPWIPTQPYFDEPISVRHYKDFATAAGCASARNVFDCLVAKDSLTLQYASNLVSGNPPTPPGNWAFTPVTGGTYVPALPPSQALLRKKVNGLNLLVGNNANEGVLLIPPTINTQDDLIGWVKATFVNLSDRNITALLEAYPSSSGPTRATDAKFETNGYGPATAVNVSQAATGQQQRAYNIGAEASVACFAQWFAAAFTSPGHTAFAYQYSVPFASHGADVSAYFGAPTENQGPELVKAFRTMFLDFIRSSNPSISTGIANGASSPNPQATNPASSWPPWTTTAPFPMLNLNISGGTPYIATAPIGTGKAVTQFREPSLRNNFTLVDAYSWEGGRGQRCDFWRTLSPSVPQ